MDRLFHHRFSMIAKLVIIIFSMLAFYFFWIKLALIGTFIVIILIGMVERILHSTYTFTSDGYLVIDNGHFSQRERILINEIIKCEPVKARLGFSRCLLIEYGAGHLLYVQPEKEEEFVKELHKRQREI